MTPAVSRRILVVDDDAGIRELARDILSGAGYDVQTAESGLDALEAALTGSFDLMLLDVNMPEMDGWEVLRLLKSDERFRALPS